MSRDILITDQTPTPVQLPIETTSTVGRDIEESAAQTKRALRDLLKIHTYKRPDRSKTEGLFIKTFLHPLGGWDDRFGNYVVEIGSSPTTLFSSHTDTVHATDGFQMCEIDKDGKTLRLNEAFKIVGNCLGGDCGVGVWLMREMILAQIPGLYVFHRGEEGGCKGSRWIAGNSGMPKDVLGGITHAIAFDRKGTTNVITHQCSERTASDTFATELARRLNQAGADLKYAPDDTGAYTDTKSYSGIVPECTNISTGYNGAHGCGETVDIWHAMQLRSALLAVDWAGLPVERDPAKKTYKDYTGNAYSYTPKYDSIGRDLLPRRTHHQDDFDDFWGDQNRRQSTAKRVSPPKRTGRFDRGNASAKISLRRLCNAKPGAVEAFLEFHGVTVEEIVGYFGHDDWQDL